MYFPRRIAVLLTLACATFLLTACGGGEDPDDADPDESSAPSVEITNYPGHNTAEAALVADGAELDFHFEIADCDSDHCHTECSFDETSYSACTSPATFDFDPTDEGLLPFHVRLFDDNAVVDEDGIVAQLRVDFDFGVDGLTADETNLFIHPIEVEPFCQHDDCRLHCEWAGDNIGCAAGDTLTLDRPDEADEATFSVEACAEPDDLDNHCFEAKEYHFDIAGSEWKQVSTGTNHTCAIFAPNDSLWCWGDNSYSQIGIGDESASYDTAQQVTVDGEPEIRWSHIATGETHTCAITDEGALYCWGNNSDDQLGLGEDPEHDATTPALVDDAQDWTAISTSYRHSCAIADGEHLYCWGRQQSGRLGTNPESPTSVPSRVLAPGTDISGEIGSEDHWGATIVEVSAGYEHTCAITDDHDAYCWGNPILGRLGVGSLNFDDVTTVPMALDAPDTDEFFSISAGAGHTCAIVNNEAQCWGFNDYGQLGDDDTSSQFSPVDVVESTGFQAISANRLHTCAIDDDGDSYCWGTDEDGQLGYDDGPNSDDDYQTTPMPVANLLDVQSIDGAHRHTCAISGDDNALHCWGQNSSGQLGIDGGDADVPTPIAWPPSL